MRTHTLTVSPTTTNRFTSAYRALRWMATDAALGAACGALFGVVISAIGLLLEAEPWNFISVAGYFALCGAAAGALVGVCSAVVGGDDVAEPDSLTPKPSPASMTPSAFVCPPTLSGSRSSHRLPRNRLVDAERGGHRAIVASTSSRN